MILSQTCRNSTAENTNFVKWSSRVDLGNTTNMNNSLFTEGGCCDKMVNGLSVDRESWLAIIEHHSPVSVDSQKVTHVTLLWLAVSTLLALPGEYRKNMVTGFEVCHTLTNTFDNPIYMFKRHFRSEPKQQNGQRNWLNLNIKRN